MTTQKCPVCDWEIKDGGIKVKVGDKEITVCCDDCARRRKRALRSNSRVLTTTTQVPSIRLGKRPSWCGSKDD